MAQCTDKVVVIMFSNGENKCEKSSTEKKNPYNVTPPSLVHTNHYYPDSTYNMDHVPERDIITEPDYNYNTI